MKEVMKLSKTIEKKYKEALTTETSSSNSEEEQYRTVLPSEEIWKDKNEKRKGKKRSHYLSEDISAAYLDAQNEPSQKKKKKKK